MAGNVGSLQLEELYVVLQLELLNIVHDAMDDVDQSSVVLEPGGEGVVLAAEHNLAR